MRAFHMLDSTTRTMPRAFATVLALALLSETATALTQSRSAMSMIASLPGKKIPISKREVREQDIPLTDRLVGACEPFPEGFDPFNFATRADKAEMTKFREAELKHGRVAMLAVPGFLLSEDFHPFFPGLPKWEFGIFASQDTLETPQFQPLLILSLIAIGAFESISIKRGWKSLGSSGNGSVGTSSSTFGKMNTEYEPGSTFERGPWTKDKLSPQEYEAKQLAELNNGRLAMISIFLIVVQELTTGLPAELFDDAILLNKGILENAM